MKKTFYAVGFKGSRVIYGKDYASKGYIELMTLRQARKEKKDLEAGGRNVVSLYKIIL